MKPSTATFIAYDLRPAKQAERRILLDFLKCSNEAGVKVSDCRYVGMGGFAFYDFHLVHRFLGIDKMTSLERDPSAHQRAKFNCPFDFITIKQRTVTQFLAHDRKPPPTIYWLDYDDGLSQEVLGNIRTLGTKIVTNGFAFVTVCAEPNGVLRDQTPDERLAHFQETFGDYAIGLTAQDLEESNFRNAVCRILVKAFEHSFTQRMEGELIPLFRVSYKDTKWMVTVGGCFCEKGKTDKVRKRIKIDLPFLLRTVPYQIGNLCLTERERVLFDRAATSQRESTPKRKLETMGFKKWQLDAYRDLIRFWPRYSESII